MPSRPVRAPTAMIGLPTPCATARMSSFSRMTPTHIALTSGLPSYEGNPLVNAMCVGVMRENELIRAVAQGVGNPIIAVGARTGRDGIHGASFASEDLRSEERRGGMGW